MYHKKMEKNAFLEYFLYLFMLLKCHAKQGKNVVNYYSLTMLGICLLAPMCEGMVFCFNSKNLQVSMKERKKELEKGRGGRGKEDGREGTRVFYSHRAERTLIPCGLHCCFSCIAVIWYMHFYTVCSRFFFSCQTLRTHLACSCIVGRYF